MLDMLKARIENRRTSDIEKYNIIVDVIQNKRDIADITYLSLKGDEDEENYLAIMLYTIQLKNIYWIDIVKRPYPKNKKRCKNVKLVINRGFIKVYMDIEPLRFDIQTEQDKDSKNFVEDMFGGNEN